MATSNETVQRFTAHSLKFASVTVYEDRAEVKRVIEVDLKKGFNKIEIQKIPEIANNDSVLVSGTGDAIIHEVEIQQKPSIPNEMSAPRISDLYVQKKNHVKDKQKLEDEKAIALCCDNLLHDIMVPASKAVFNKHPHGDGEPEEGQDLDHVLSGIDRLIKYHEQSHTAMVHKKRQIDEQIEECDEKIKKLEAEINQAKCSDAYIKSICISLEAKSDCSANLLASYQVPCARWYPCYDIRMDSVLKILKLTFNGKIHQTSGEDWMEAPLILSSARPTCGGTIPKLGTLYAEFYVPPVHHPRPMFGAVSKRSMGADQMVQCFSTFDAESMPAIGSAPVMHTETLMSSEFAIERLATIPSDGSDHKVTIGVVQSEPKLFYVTVPSKSTNVFLSASMINNSAFPLLAGSTSVYVDNSFIASSTIKNVQPGERFICSLGVDPAIKIEYKPARKFTEQAGILTKTATVSHEQRIIIRNKKTTSILITVREQVPESTDEKIKVKLYSPELTRDLNAVQPSSGDEFEPELGVRLDSNHNLLWTVEIRGNEEKELSIKWSMEHPVDKVVKLNEHFSRDDE